MHEIYAHDPLASFQSFPLKLIFYWTEVLNQFQIKKSSSEVSEVPISMVKKSKSDAICLDEVDHTMYVSICSVVNPLTQLYTQAMNQQRLFFQACELHALEGKETGLYQTHC